MRKTSLEIGKEFLTELFFCKGKFCKQNECETLLAHFIRVSTDLAARVIGSDPSDRSLSSSEG